MLNVKTLTDTMSRMELPQLQQYATLHKNDPYIVTLALSIANQKKQMKMGQDGQAGMMPQPKVVDQKIDQMAAPPQQMAQAMPEDQGIATLPAPNMQNMASGGIVAFDEGGDVPGYAGPTGSFIGTSNMAPVPGAIVIGNMYIDPETGERKYLPGAEPTPVTQEQRNLANAKLIPSLSDVADVFRTPYGQKQAAIARQNQAATEQNKALLERNKPRRSEEQLFASDVAKRNDAVDPAATAVNTPGAGTLPAAAAPAAEPAGNYEDAYTTGINKLLGSVQTAGSTGPINKLDAKKYSYTPAEFAGMTPEFFADAVTKAMGKDPAKDPFGGQTENLTKTAVAAKQNYKTDLEKQFKEQGLAFEGTLKKLTEKEGRINTMEERNTGMALLEAGLSMMSGESPHALVNIGKGAQVGTKKYAEGMAQIEASRDKLDDAKMKIEEFRRNEANMNARESRAAQKDIDDTLHQGAVLKLAGMRDAFNMNKQQAIASVTTYAQIQTFNVGEKNKAAAQNQQTAAGIDTAYAQMANASANSARSNATQLGIAALQAKMPPAEARTAMMLGTGTTDAARLESGLKKMQEVTSDKTGMAAVKLLTETNAKRETAMLPPLTMDELLRSAKEYQTLMYPKVVTDPGAKAPVYGRP